MSSKMLPVAGRSEKIRREPVRFLRLFNSAERPIATEEYWILAEPCVSVLLVAAPGFSPSAIGKFRTPVLTVVRENTLELTGSGGGPSRVDQCR